MIGHHGHEILAPADLMVGQEVRVQSTWHRKQHGPDGAPAWVTKVGRKLVTITTNPDGGDHLATNYRIVEQVENGDGVGDVAVFRTLGQVADESRVRAATDVINAAGWSRRMGVRSTLTVDQLEAIARIIDPTFGGV